MKRRPLAGSSRVTTTAAPPTWSPEVVGFIAAILRQMDHAANLVVAFFRSVGMMGPHDHSLPDLPREFLLELGALLQAREWHAAGLIDWFDPEGLSIDDMIGRAIERLKNDPAAVAAGRCGTEAMTDVLRIWTERCAPDARGHLDADVAIRWERHDDGVEHEVSGKWHESTVHALATNPIIIGVKEYGRYSEGVHHRAQGTGFRPVTEDELLLDGSGKTIENDVSDRIRAAAGFAAQFDPDRWHRLQDNLKSRGSSQRGKRKAHDPAAYPLTPCVFDLTCGCGGIMHGAVRKDRGAGRPMYRCSIYTKTQGEKCNHNNIDGEALLRFTARTLVTLMQRAAGKDKLRTAVVARIREMQKAPPSPDEAIREKMLAQVERQRQKVAQAPKRILEEDDDELRAALRAGFREMQADLATKEKALADADRRMPHREPPANIEAEVEKAMALMDRIETVCANPAAREELNRLVQDLGIRIGLTFREGHRNNRPARILQGGIVAFGNRPLPCTLRNSSGRPLAGGLPETLDDEHSDDDLGGQHCRHEEHPDGASGFAAGSKKAPSNRKGGSTGSRRTSRGGVRPSPADRQTPRQPSETGRLYKASRGDRI